MIGQWAIVLDLADGDSAGSLFDRDVEVLESNDRLWLRGNAFDEELQKHLHRLPALGRFAVGSNGVLTPHGKQAPTGLLPSGDWKPLEQWLRLKPEVAMLPGVLSKKATLRLIRISFEAPARNLPPCGGGGELASRRGVSAGESEAHRADVVIPPPAASGDLPRKGGGVKEVAATGLLLSVDTWAKYAETASAMRLSSLLFAADEERVLVIGTHLPPLPGTRLSMIEDVAVPLGWSWSPALPPIVLRNILGAADDMLALWLPDQPVELISKNSFVVASRSAVRLTVGGVDG